MQYYRLVICGLSRDLPLAYVSKKAQLANFSILGDVELVDILADRLSQELGKLQFDYLVALEIKVVPLVHGIAKRLGYPRFVVCRKSVKPYMVAPKILRPLPYFPKHTKPLVLDGRDTELLENKRVVVVDTVISTGVTMRMAKKLMEKVGAKVVKLVAVLRQGQQFDHFEDLVYLAEIPIFQKAEKNTP